MDEIVATETLIIELLLIISLVAIVGQRLRVPYTVALVLVGLVLSLQPSLRVAVELTPDLILALFVPPLIFEAAFHLHLDELRKSLWPILVLAVPGVLIATVLVGLIVSFGTGLPLAVAMVFGALISATDPVAVVALFRVLGAPKKLTVLVEGESLFNDGTAIVIFSLMLSIAISAVGSEPAEFNIALAVFDFVRVSAGGLLVGGVLGFLTARVIARVDDYLIETTLTVVLAFGSYLLAEGLHFSGVLAVVSAGLVNGNIGERGMSPTTRISLGNFWEYLAFFANSLVFLLIGLDIEISHLAENIGAIFIAVLAVIAARAVVVYSLTWLVNQRTRADVSLQYRHVLFWGGLRGAISLALALSLPPALNAGRPELLRSMAFGVVLFTLLVQGTTMQVLLGKLGLITHSEDRLEYERRHGRLMAARAARNRLEELYRDGMITSATRQQLSGTLDDSIQEHLEAQNELLNENPHLKQEDLHSARRETLRAQRARLSLLVRDGALSEDIYEELVTELDAALDSTENA